MPKVEFSKTSASTPASPEAAGATITETPTTAIATRSANPAPVPFSDENIPLGDIILPRLNIVQKVGELSNIFDGGTILLNAEQVIYSCPKDAKLQAPSPEAPTPLSILVLGLQAAKYVEKTEGGTRGSIYNTAQEVVNAGGTLDYNEAKVTGRPLYQPSRTALVLLEKPEGIDDANFPHQRDGKQYCTALWSMKGSSYNNGAKVLMTARQIGKLRDVKDAEGNVIGGGYRSAFYTFATKLASYNGQFYYIPVLRPADVSTPEFRAWIKDEVVGF